MSLLQGDTNNLPIAAVCLCRYSCYFNACTCINNYVRVCAGKLFQGSMVPGTRVVLQSIEGNLLVRPYCRFFCLRMSVINNRYEYEYLRYPGSHNNS